MFNSNTDHMCIINGEDIASLHIGQSGLLWMKEEFLIIKTKHNGTVHVYLDHLKDAFLTVQNMKSK